MNGLDTRVKKAKNQKLSGKQKKKLDATRDREEGKVRKKTKTERIEGQKRGTGVKALIKKVQVKKAKAKAVKKNEAKMSRAKVKAKGRK